MWQYSSTGVGCASFCWGISATGCLLSVRGHLSPCLGVIASKYYGPTQICTGHIAIPQYPHQLYHWHRSKLFQIGRSSLGIFWDRLQFIPVSLPGPTRARVVALPSSDSPHFCPWAGLICFSWHPCGCQHHREGAARTDAVIKYIMVLLWQCVLEECMLCQLRKWKDWAISCYIWTMLLIMKRKWERDEREIKVKVKRVKKHLLLLF